MSASIVTSAVQWIGSLLIQEASTLFEVSDQVESLREELELMQQYLQDVDAKQDAAEFRALIGQIRTVAWVAEDVIDTYILRVQSKAEPSYRCWLTKCVFFLYRSTDIYSVGKQIHDMQTRTKRLSDRLNGYGLGSTPGPGWVQERIISSGDEGHWRRNRQSYPYDDNDAGEHVVGFKEDIPKLVEALMGEGKSHINFVSIVGMGGCGKTTLARKLYNHHYTQECFNCKAWVSISQECDTRHVLSEILGKVGGPKERIKLQERATVGELVDRLRNILNKKSYLVVLDDVWSKKDIQEMKPAFPLGSIGRQSKIIITTRNREVVELPDLQLCMQIHEPQPLTEEEGWELFRKIAFNHHCNLNNKSFKSLGMEMLKKCDGLPLAIVALAGILNTRRSIGEWQRVNESVRARVMEGTCTHTYGRVGVLLALSYDDLPSDLKNCFLHLAVFPEDCQIPTGMLTRMWIGEGLVTPRERIALEDVALLQLEELGQRFMIQVVRTNFKGEIKAIRMHDLLRDLCVKKAKEQSFAQIFTRVNDTEAGIPSATSIQPRRVAVHSSLDLPERVSKLRSLVLLTRSSVMNSAYASKETLDLKVVYNNFKLLRLLNLWGIKTSRGKLPNEIGSLFHLRYLGMRATNITQLPMSIGKLRNFLTLDYRNIDCVDNVPIKVPNVFRKLEHLRHLFLPMKHDWDVEDDLELNAMKSLQILWGLKRGREGDWFSRELSKLSTTLKKLRVVVSRESELRAAFNCPSLMNDVLRTFHCELRGGFALQHVKPICDNQHLHKLILIGKIQMQLTLLLPCNLVMLELNDSVLNDDPMPAIGELAHLKLLRLSSSYDGATIACKAGSFPQLEELYLQNFRNLEEWEIEEGAMVCLRRLEITECRQLRLYPQGLGCITTLQQFAYFGVPTEFLQKARENGWSDEKLRLPHNCDAIIEQCDLPVNTSSIAKLYQQLTAGVFLNNKKQKYWVTKQHDRYYNWFMLYAKGLFLTASDHHRLPLPKLDDYWHWSKVVESDGASITVGTLVTIDKQPRARGKSSTAKNGSSSAIMCDKFQVRGHFDSTNLSPQVKYEISYVIMLPEKSTSGRYMQAVIGTLNGYEVEHELDGKPRDEWIRLTVGEAYIEPDHVKHMKFTLEPLEPGVVVKGVCIEPKL